MNYIVIDLEFNQPFQFEHGKKPKPVAKCPFEIIQIGALILDEQLNIIRTADYFIKPQLYTILHPYVEKLTDIRIEALKDQPFFPEVYERFIDFINPNGLLGTEYVFCTWGGADIIALYKNAAYYNLDLKRIPNRYINVQDMATKKLKPSRGANIGLKNAVNEFGLDEDLSFHYALNDAIYTARIFMLLRGMAYTIKTYNGVE